MEKIIHNEDDLKMEDIDEVVTRVKAFIINEKNEIIIAKSNGGYQLPGGHVEFGEKEHIALKREIEEETGIALDSNEIKTPFFEIDYYKYNYNQTNKNRLSKVIYYVIETNEYINLDKMKLTEREKTYNFNLCLINFFDFENVIENSISEMDVEINKAIAKEMLIAFRKLKEFYYD